MSSSYPYPVEKHIQKYHLYISLYHLLTCFLRSRHIPRMVEVLLCPMLLELLLVIVLKVGSGQRSTM